MSNSTDQAEIPENDPTGEEVEAREEEDLQQLKNATARLMEFFDVVHIFASRYNSVEAGGPQLFLMGKETGAPEEDRYRTGWVCRTSLTLRALNELG